jgi:excisionase family DNA binding protein
MKPSSARITVAEIAADLGLGRLKVYEMLECTIPEARIPGYKVGHRWIVMRGAYEQWKRTFGTKFLEQRVEYMESNHQ